MCKYIYETDGHSKGTKCIYPNFYRTNIESFKQFNKLPIDSDGYCIFHSKDKHWKDKNNFKGMFNELIDVLSNYFKEDKKNNSYNFSGFVFTDESGRFLLEGITLKNDLVLTNSLFIDNFYISNCNFTGVDYRNSTFEKYCTFSNTIFNHTLLASGTTYNGLDIIDCLFMKQSKFEDSFFNSAPNNVSINIRQSYNKENVMTFNDSVFFSNSKINGIFSIESISFKDSCSFNSCIILDQFILRNSTINRRMEILNTLFTLPYDETGYFSTVNIFKLTINQNARLVFKGNQPMQNMVEGEMSISLSPNSSGIIEFENFNLNRIDKKDKDELMILEKKGSVVIGKGCRKYYCQTEIFTIESSKEGQNLILDIVRVFCNYFQTSNNFNLGIEIVERDNNYIKYFYFTDEPISLIDFLNRINQTEYNLWNTFSNIAQYSIASINDIETKRHLIDIAAFFYKLGISYENKLINNNDIKNALDSISANGISEFNPTTNLIELKIEKGYSIVDTKLLADEIVSKIASYQKLIPQITHMQVTNIYNEKIEKVINSENYFESNQTLSDNTKKIVLEEIQKIMKENSPEKKEGRLKKLIQDWLPTITEAGAKAIKELVIK